MYLEEIEKNIGFEGVEFECKARLNRDEPIGWLKTIAGFSNATGGRFYIGVEDKTNKLIGFDRKEADNERNYFNNQINEHIAPRPDMKIHFIKYMIRKFERYIIRVDVAESNKKPIIVTFQGIPSIFMRRDGFTNGATYEEIHEMSLQATMIQYDQMTTDVLFHESRFQKLKACMLKRTMVKNYPRKRCSLLVCLKKIRN